MCSVPQIVYPSLVAIMLAVAPTVPADARRCDAVLPDGRVIRSGAAVDEHGRTCDEFFAARRAPKHDDFARHDFGLREAARPRMGFTTGNIGPFTTGEIGPFTTFSNSPPARHR